MITAKKLQSVIFLLLLVTWVSLYMANSSSRVVNTRNNVNIVTDSVAPLKQALCIDYNDSDKYPINGIA